MHLKCLVVALAATFAVIGSLAAAGPQTRRGAAYAKGNQVCQPLGSDAPSQREGDKHPIPVWLHVGAQSGRAA